MIKSDPRCRIEMLGPLRVVRSDRTLTRFAPQKAMALLSYLALRPGPHPREQVVDLFWPEMNLSDGRNNLSTALSHLRRHLEPMGVRRGSLLVTTHSQIGLDPAAVTTDVAEFERLCAEGEAAGLPERAADLLARAAALYVGDFQPGNYSDWAVRESERLQTVLVAALDRLGEAWESLGRFADAAEAARRRVAVDPYTEEAYVSLVRRLIQAGQQSGAREAAQSFEKFFRREFGSGPSPAASRAIEILLGPSPGEPRAVPLPAIPKPRAVTPAPVEPMAPPVAPLPFWLSRFFSREMEIERLAGLLLPPKDVISGSHLPLRPCRLVTLTGPGGAGKTRLAAEFARQISGSFGHWCGFVSLADLTSPSQIYACIAQSLRLPPLPNETAEEQIAAYFRMRDGLAAPTALLILDNLEQLLGAGDKAGGEPSASGIVRRLLEQSPSLAILCTSRRPLGVPGEQVLPVGPLSVPEAPEPGVPAASLSETWLQILMVVSSVRLYLDRAQAVRPDFGLTPVNAPAVVALCRALEGSPLALELAASWVRLLPPRKMWERLAQGLGVPEGRNTDLPPRQRSLSSALEWSWRLLTEPQQRLLARLSVFRGGWSLDAAEAVCDAPEALGLLADLGEASLVEAAEAGNEEMRYRLLETVRAFSRQKLEEKGEWEDLRGRHSAFFGTWVVQTEPKLRGANQKFWFDTLESEHENLRAALEWHVSAAEALGRSEDGLRMASALAPFWRARGYLREGHDWHRALLSRPEASFPTSARADALNRVGELTTLLAAYGEAEAYHQEALAISRAIPYVLGEADALLGLGTTHYWRQDYPAAALFYDESLALRREHTDEQGRDYHRLWGEAATFHSLGNLAMRREEYTEALTFFEQALSLRRQQGDSLGVAGTLGALGQAALSDGSHDEAARHTVEALHLFNEAGQRWTVALCLSALSLIAEAQGKTVRCVRLLGAAAALREQFHFPLPPAERAGQEEREARLRAGLGTKAFDAAWSEGRGLSWEDTVALAQSMEP